jgi:hypothetical protein
MPKGKPWSPEDEKKLRELLKIKDSLRVIASKLGKSSEAIRQKMYDLGLKEEEQTKIMCSTSSLTLPKELPSIEQILKVLAAALKALEQPGLEQADVLRLRSIIQGAKTYKDLFADYVDYRGIEVELVEVRQKYEALAKKTQSVPS